jgi:hypothetical protein
MSSSVSPATRSAASKSVGPGAAEMIGSEDRTTPLAAPGIPPAAAAMNLDVDCVGEAMFIEVDCTDGCGGETADSVRERK